MLQWLMVGGISGRGKKAHSRIDRMPSPRLFNSFTGSLGAQAFSLPQGFPGELHVMRIVDHAIHNRIGNRLVVEEIMPDVHRCLAGDER